MSTSSQTTTAGLSEGEESLRELLVDKELNGTNGHCHINGNSGLYRSKSSGLVQRASSFTSNHQVEDISNTDIGYTPIEEKPQVNPSNSFPRWTPKKNGHNWVESAASLASLHLPDPSVLRATRAYRALAKGGQVLREGTPLKVGGNHSGQHWYAKSFPVDNLDDFWSHSWRAPPFQKITTLMLYYHGRPAVFVSLVCSLVVGYIYSQTQWLSPMHEMDHFCQAKQKEEKIGVAVWCQCAGALAFIITLFMWRSRRLVFVDKMCIHQTDPHLKLMGIESIGVFLRKSRHMILMWESTYFGRLWCTFELAAFAKTHDNDSMHVRPLVWGMVCAVLTLSTLVNGLYDMLIPSSTGFAVAPWDSEKGAAFWRFGGAIVHALVVTPALHCLRNYHRSMTALTSQLQNFQVAKAGCYCCSVKHVDPVTGDELICDREAVTLCIKKWFHNVANFELYVHCDLQKHFDKQLGKVGIPYKLAIVCCTPVFWAHVDKASARLRQEKSCSEHMVYLYLVKGALLWFLAHPLLIQWLAFLAKIFQRRRSTRIRDWSTSALLAMSVVPITMVGYIMWWVMHSTSTCALKWIEGHQLRECWSSAGNETLKMNGTNATTLTWSV